MAVDRTVPVAVSASGRPVTESATPTMMPGMYAPGVGTQLFAMGLEHARALTAANANER
jgi:hypothetical protein